MSPRSRFEGRSVGSTGFHSTLGPQHRPPDHGRRARQRRRRPERSPAGRRRPPRRRAGPRTGRRRAAGRPPNRPGPRRTAPTRARAPPTAATSAATGATTGRRRPSDDDRGGDGGHQREPRHRGDALGEHELAAAPRPGVPSTVDGDRPVLHDVAGLDAGRPVGPHPVDAVVVPGVRAARRPPPPTRVSASASALRRARRRAPSRSSLTYVAGDRRLRSTVPSAGTAGRARPVPGDDHLGAARRPSARGRRRRRRPRRAPRRPPARCR